MPQVPLPPLTAGEAAAVTLAVEGCGQAVGNALALALSPAKAAGVAQVLTLQGQRAQPGEFTLAGKACLAAIAAGIVQRLQATKGQ